MSSRYAAAAADAPRSFPGAASPVDRPSLTIARWNRIFFVLGALLFVYLIHSVGWKALIADVRRFGWLLLMVLLLSGMKYAISATAWSAAFFSEERQSWRSLFGCRVAGEAINYLSAGGPLLGEPVKASLLRGIRFLPGLTSAVLESSVNTVAATLVTVTGLGLLVIGYAPGGAVLYASEFAIALLLILVSGFAVVLWRRPPLLKALGSALARVAWMRRTNVQQKLAQFEERLYRLSSERPAALLWVFLLSLAAQGLALLEVAVVLSALGISPEISTVLIIEALTKLAKSMFFFVPTRIGADEGSSAGVFVLLGLAPGAGILLALARRLRAVFWSGVGLAFLYGYGQKRAPRNEAGSKTEVRCNP